MMERRLPPGPPSSMLHVSSGGHCTLVCCLLYEEASLHQQESTCGNHVSLIPHPDYSNQFLLNSSDCNVWSWEMNQGLNCFCSLFTRITELTESQRLSENVQFSPYLTEIPVSSIHHSRLKRGCLVQLKNPFCLQTRSDNTLYKLCSDHNPVMINSTATHPWGVPGRWSWFHLLSDALNWLQELVPTVSGEHWKYEAPCYVTFQCVPAVEKC